MIPLEVKKVETSPNKIPEENVILRNIITIVTWNNIKNPLKNTSKMLLTRLIFQVWHKNKEESAKSRALYALRASFSTCSSVSSASCLTCLASHVSRALRAFVPHVPCALRFLVHQVPRALRVLMPQVSLALSTPMFHILHTVHALLLTTMMCKLC